MPAPVFIDRLRRALHGPPPRWPALVERSAERWASYSTRQRIAVRVAAVLLCVALAAEWSAHVDRRWGGPGVPVLIATADMQPGAEPDQLELRLLPPAALPPDAVALVPDGARLAFLLPLGAVLTAAHLDARGPGAALAAGRRVLPIPVEEGWAISAGEWVDVWVLTGEQQQARLVARSCAVLQVSARDNGTWTALVALPDGVVGEVAQGIAAGRVLLAHAPAP